MILLFLLSSFLFFQVDARAESIRSHLSDNVKLKCEALPYRSLYVDNRCYFAVLDQIQFSNASATCSSILKGSKVATDAPGTVFDGMMVTKSKFHVNSNAGGAKNVVCLYDTGYKCEDTSIKINSGRCLLRAPKKMSFADATNYCADRDMELPSPANDQDNKIVRDALNKDPAWVQKSIIKDSIHFLTNYKWTQGNSYFRWTTCDRPAAPRLYAGNQNSLWACNKNMASIIDKTGYWSNGEVNYLMDVVCLKNAANDFTKGNSKEKCVEYHNDFAGKSTIPMAAPATPQTVDSGICYVEKRTATRYEVLARANVETRRGCEVLCDVQIRCTAFAFKDAGLTSPCTLLTSKATKDVCSKSVTVYMKKTSGCVARTNLTEEFGKDPCIDEIVPSAFLGVGRDQICKQDKNNILIIRAIDWNGRRFTLDNDKNNYLDKVGNVIRYRFDRDGRNTIIPVVALVCAVAGGDKCPCGHLPHDKIGFGIGTASNIAPVPNVLNPCSGKAAYLYCSVIKMPGYVWGIAPADTLKAFVNCRAGMWIVWEESVYNTFGVSGMACNI